MNNDRIPNPGTLRQMNRESGGKWFEHCDHYGEKLSDFHTRQNPDFPELIDLINKRTEEVKGSFFKTNGRVAAIFNGAITNPKQGEMTHVEPAKIEESSDVSYYKNQFAKLKSHGGIPLAIQIRDSDCKYTHWININNESIPILVEFLNSQKKG